MVPFVFLSKHLVVVVHFKGHPLCSGASRRDRLLPCHKIGDGEFRFLGQSHLRLLLHIAYVGFMLNFRSRLCISLKARRLFLGLLSEGVLDRRGKRALIFRGGKIVRLVLRCLLLQIHLTNALDNLHLVQIVLASFLLFVRKAE